MTSPAMDPITRMLIEGNSDVAHLSTFLDTPHEFEGVVNLDMNLGDEVIFHGTGAGRGNGIKIATMPYHVSSPDLAPQGRARFGIVAI